MYKPITTEQLNAAVTSLVTHLANPTPEQARLVFTPTVEYCDGPTHTVCLRYCTYPWMSNFRGVVHGGMVATLLDSAMGITCRSLYGARKHVATPTITLTVNYARPVPLESDILIRVRAVTTGATSTQMTADLYLPGEEDAVLATASGIFHTVNAMKEKKTDMV